MGDNPEDEDIMAGLDFTNMDLLASDDEEDEDQSDALAPAFTREQLMAATRANRQPSVLTVPELLPPELADYDLGAFDIIPVEQRGGTDSFVGLYLAATRQSYLETGVGVYEAVLNFRMRRRVNDQDVADYLQRVRAMISRVRKAAPGSPFFYVVRMNYEILPANHVAISVARMAPKPYRSFITEQKRMSAEITNTVNQLKDLL